MTQLKRKNSVGNLIKLLYMDRFQKRQILFTYIEKCSYWWSIAKFLWKFLENRRELMEFMEYKYI